ncbi:hypothetical protein J5N97_028055 [Dioscorea zingiberensis]|uniref:Uncharacterized protein n=1 Tax=Dioscorea zingiberensis TaxID=325984 RepID=A0A9D5BYA4_9LILI|nr:hypothetical protein J5N97_028055 [Dioscorea zingiberensis]
MDALELPLPANVAVKLLAPDGFGRVGKSENGPDSSVFGGRKAAGYGSYHKEINCPVANSECTSASRNKGADVELFMRDKLPSIKREENGNKRHHLGETDMLNSLLLKHESQQSNRKSAKNLSILPCPKRPRTDLPEHSFKTCGSDASKEITRNIGIDIISSNSVERSRKQKRFQDGKKTDKKSFRAGGKSKYEAGLASSDLTSGANILGIYGLKSDHHDVVELVDEVSLSDLLDGSHRCPKLCPDKGKKTGNANENTLGLVKRACGVLTSHATVDSSDPKKAPASILNLNECSVKMSNFDGIHKCIEESISNKVEDLGEQNMKNAALYHPKEVLDRLALSPAHDLDALIRDSNLPSLSTESAKHAMSLHSAKLPTFPWSFSHNGTCKSSSDGSKTSSTRITYNGRWVRIWNNPASIGDERSSSAELDTQKCDNKYNCLNQQKMNDLLQYVMSMSFPDKAPEQSLISPNNLQEAKPSNSATSMEICGAFGSCDPHKRNLLPGHAESSGAQFAEGGFRCQEKQTNFSDSLQSNMSICTDQHVCGSNGCSDSSHCKSANVGSSQSPSRSSILDALKSGYSQRVLAAAETLCEMASSSNAIRARNQNDGILRRLKAAPEKTIVKSRKSIFPMGKQYEPILAVRPHDSIKTTGVSSTKQKSVAEKNSIHINSIGRSPVRSSVSSEGASLCKLERELSTHHLKPLLGNSFKLSSSPMHSVSRFERDYDSPQKSRHFGGTSIKDWSRGKSKRL